MLTLRTRRYWFFAVTLAFLVAQSCGWKTTMTFPSPSGKARIEVWQRRINSTWGARVELVTADRRTVLRTVSRDTIILLVHVYWSPDESKVGVVVSGTTIFNVAGDVKTGAPIPFAGIRNEVAKSINEMYHVPAGEDPIQWAAMTPAQDEFAKLYPKFRHLD